MLPVPLVTVDGFLMNQSGVQTSHRQLSGYIAPLLCVSTAVVFWSDLHLELGFVPWLAYLLLAFIVSRLYSRTVVVLATAGWSVLIAADLLISSSGSMTAGLFNRALGLVTLWLLVYFLEKEKRVETDRLETGLRLRAILDGALDAVIGMDHTGHIIEWSPQAEKTFGFSRRQAVGSPLADLIIPPSYREAHAKGLKRYLHTGTPSILHKRIEITALHQDGHEFPVELTVIPLHFGPQLTFCAFLRDITEQRRAQQELKDSKTFLGSIVENLPMMVFVKDAHDLRFVRLNKTGEDLIGVPEADLIGLNDYDLFPKEQADFFTGKDRAVLESGRLQDIPEEPIQTNHKGERILHTKKIPIFDSAGRPQYLLGISEDITERKQAEDALRRSQQAAEAANKSKSEFLANMSHEIRTPLNAVLGMLGLSSHSASTPEQREYALVGQRAGQVLLHLVNDLLDMAKVEARTLQLNPQPFNLRELLLRTQSMMRPRAHEKGLALDLTVYEEVPTHIVGDVTRIQQILLNLIGNAIKFTDRGQVNLSVSVVPVHDSEERSLQFAVADSGIGIPPKQHETIFERFTQIDSGDNRKYGGAGLGLAISRQLARLMGGTIRVESRAGHGSTFTFIMPCHCAAPTEQGVVPAPSDTPADTPVPDFDKGSASALKPLRILVVDDFPETLQLVKAYLKHCPYQLDLAKHGEEAIQRCQACRYDLVLMDMQMPGMDGYAVTTAVRAWERAQGLAPVPIIAMTADVFRSAQERSAASGCTGFLGKPFTQAALLEMIQRHAHSPGKQQFADSESPAAQPPAASMEPDLQCLRRAFLQNRRKDIQVLTAALTETDFQSVQTVGHRIKGLAGSYGFEEIGAIGATIEQAAAQGDSAAVHQQIQRLEKFLMTSDEDKEKAA